MSESEQINHTGTPDIRPHRTHRLQNIAASILSSVFSPLLIPTIAMVIALWLTPMYRLSLSVRGWSTLGVFFITAVIPGLSILTLMKMGRASDTALSDRRERPLPFMITLACYIIAAIYLAALHAPRWLVAFVVAGAVIVLAELLISYRWKISAHTGGCGGLVGLLFWLAVRGALIYDALTLVSIAVLVLGLVAWARLVLRRHTLGQVAAGAALGFLVEFGIMCLA